MSHPGPAKSGESEFEKLAQQKTCMHCGKDRAMLHLEPKRKTTLRACTNKDCFKFVDIPKLSSWKL